MDRELREPGFEEINLAKKKEGPSEYDMSTRIHIDTNQFDYCFIKYSFQLAKFKGISRVEVCDIVASSLE